ncbi:peroxidase 27-like [Oryza brachyantha]|uniref:peroxidase 27-like n=1 Tax=Oryza brachyantha TaxID=4533 RepID=UPI0003EADEA1|nr:peroxidase 27-like [Oryza brachyantha]
MADAKAFYAILDASKEYLHIFTQVSCLTAATNSMATDGFNHFNIGTRSRRVEGWVLDVEKIFNSIVVDSVKTNCGKGAGLVRLLFHDCFVRRCDATVLLEKSEVNHQPEEDSGTNIGIQGMGVINTIKAALEDRCPNTVSCADIIAYAARDMADVYQEDCREGDLFVDLGLDLDNMTINGALDEACDPHDLSILTGRKNNTDIE